MPAPAFEPHEIAASVWAVPPLAHRADESLDPEQNARLVRHLEAYGIRTLLYGGNANFHHLPPSEYRATLEMLAGVAAPGSWVIPSAGPDYGRLHDQATLIRDLPFAAVLALPESGPTTGPGIMTGLRRFSERARKPLVLYLKSEAYLRPAQVAALVDDGSVCIVKYAVPREDPTGDPYLEALLAMVDRRLVVSGMGERPAPIHLREFGLAGYTSGGACLAPRTAVALAGALLAGDATRSARLRAAFLPLEDLRDRFGSIPVLHAAVTLSGIADMGPLRPLLHDLEPDRLPAVAAAVQSLRDFEAAVETPAATAGRGP
jgi:dihydrodipicolinate synthase/N-acetylneuraminate lyase